MIIAVVAGAIVLLAVALVVIVAVDPGPPPGDVALAYERAWDRFDFESLWSLSGDELRDGMGRDEFVRAKRETYADRPELGNLARSVVVEQVHAGDVIAVARTRVELREGGTTTNELQLEKRGGRWVVVSYELEPESPRSGPGPGGGPADPALRMHHDGRPDRRS